MTEDAARIVALLGLQPHPEGGFYRETHRGALVLRGLPHGAPRAAHTAIYFLALAGCTVAPGFDFADFAMPDRRTLLARFPAHAEVVTKLTRP